jgi:hypothetical protein
MGRIDPSGRTDPDPLLDRCGQLADAVYDWWRKSPPPLSYRARTSPGIGRSIAFTQETVSSVQTARPLREATTLHTRLTLLNGFEVPSPWLRSPRLSPPSAVWPPSEERTRRQACDEQAWEGTGEGPDLPLMASQLEPVSLPRRHAGRSLMTLVNAGGLWHRNECRLASRPPTRSCRAGGRRPQLVEIVGSDPLTMNLVIRILVERDLVSEVSDDPDEPGNDGDGGPSEGCRDARGSGKAVTWCAAARH